MDPFADCGIVMGGDLATDREQRGLYHDPVSSLYAAHAPPPPAHSLFIIDAKDDGNGVVVIDSKSEATINVSMERIFQIAAISSFSTSLARAHRC